MNTDITVVIGGITIIQPKSILTLIPFFNTLFLRWNNETNKEINLPNRNPIVFLKLIDAVKNGGEIKNKHISEAEFYGILPTVKDETILKIAKRHTNTATLNVQNTSSLIHYILFHQPPPYSELNISAKDVLKSIFETITVSNDFSDAVFPKLGFTNMKDIIYSESYIDNENRLNKIRHIRTDIYKSCDVVTKVEVEITLPSLKKNYRYIKDIGYHLFENVSLNIFDDTKKEFSGKYMLIKSLLTENVNNDVYFDYEDVYERSIESKKNVTVSVTLPIPSLLSCLYFGSSMNLDISIAPLKNLIVCEKETDYEDITFEENRGTISIIKSGVIFPIDCRGLIYQNESEIEVIYTKLETVYSSVNNEKSTELRFFKSLLQVSRIIIYCTFQEDIERKNLSNFGCFKELKDDCSLSSPIDTIDIVYSGSGQIIHTVTRLNAERITPMNLYKRYIPGIYIIDMEKFYTVNPDLMARINEFNFTTPDIKLNVNFGYKFKGTVTAITEFKNILTYTK